MKKSIDIQLFKEVLLYSQKYFQLNVNSLDMPSKVLEALINDTVRQLDIEIPNVNIVFDYVEVHDFVWDVSDKLNPAAAAAKKVKSHKVKLMEMLVKESKLSKYLKDQGLENRLTFESDDSKGGAGVTTNMWLGLVGINEDTQSVSTDFAIYRATQIKKPFFWVQPMTKTLLKGWGVWAFILIPVCVVLGIPFLLFSLSKIESSIYVVFVVISVYLLWRLGYIIYELMDKGVAKAPDFMIRWFDRNALFTVNREVSTDKEKKKAKLIELITFEAECPICGDIILKMVGKNLTVVTLENAR
jgi:hypothetical protein